jgi:hypothetical protein
LGFKPTPLYSEGSQVKLQEQPMIHSLPLYRLGESYVEAFMIIQIETSEVGATLWGPSGIRQAVRKAYLDYEKPGVGGYYVCFTDGYETFVNADAFRDNFRPAE